MKKPIRMDKEKHMDLSDIYEEELDNLKEREKTMIIEIAGMNLEIPTELVQERMDRMYIDTMEENIEDIKRIGDRFFKCFKPGELKTKEDFQNEMIGHLESELELYK